MTGIFRANNPLNASILFVYGLLLKMAWFLNGNTIPKISDDNGFLYNGLIGYLSPAFRSWPVLVPAIGYLLLFTQALSLNHLLNKRRMMAKPNYLPGMSYLLVTSFFPDWNVLSAPLIVTSFLIWIWFRLTNLSNVHEARSVLYNVGLVIGICSLLYFPSLAFVFIVIIGLTIVRAPKITEWIMVLFGLLTVWYFVFAILFLTDKIYSFNIQKIVFEGWKMNWNPLQFVGLVIIGIAFLAGGYFVQDQSSKQVIQVRKRWAFLFLNVLVLLVIPFLQNHENLSDWVLIALPLSAFIAAVFFYLQSKLLRLILHWGMVAFILYCQYY